MCVLLRSLIISVCSLSLFAQDANNTGNDALNAGKAATQSGNALGGMFLQTGQAIEQSNEARTKAHEAISAELKAGGVNTELCKTAGSDEKLFQSSVETIEKAKTCSSTGGTLNMPQAGSCANPDNISYAGNDLIAAARVCMGQSDDGDAVQFPVLLPFVYEKCCAENGRTAANDKKKSAACTKCVSLAKARSESIKDKVNNLCDKCEAYNEYDLSNSKAFTVIGAITSAASTLGGMAVDIAGALNEKHYTDPSCQEKCSKYQSRGSDAVTLCMCNSGCGYGLEKRCDELKNGKQDNEDTCEKQLSFMKDDPMFSNSGDYQNLLGKCKCQAAGMNWNTSIKKCEGEASGETETAENNGDEKGPEYEDTSEQLLADATETMGGGSGAPEKDGTGTAQALSGSGGTGLTGKKDNAQKGNKKDDKFDHIKANSGKLGQSRSGRTFNKNLGARPGKINAYTKKSEIPKDISASKSPGLFQMISRVYENGIKANKFMALAKRTKRRPSSIKRTYHKKRENKYKYMKSRH